MSDDARHAWFTAQEYQRAFYGRDLIARAFPGAGILRQVLTLAPVVDQGDLFQLDPDLTRRAPVSRHRWLIAVRGWSAEQLEGEPHDTVAANLSTAIGAAARTLMGGDILDIVACDAKLSRVRGVFTAAADALGTIDEAAPVRVVRTPLAWLRRVCDGVLPLGTAAQQQATLRACAGGIVCDDVEHGEAVQRLIRRPLPELPRVMVAA